VSGGWAAWMTATVGTVIRRDLVAGTNLTGVTTPSPLPNRASLDAGSNGDVAHEHDYGGGSGGTSVIKFFHDGTTTAVYSSSAVGLARPKTDGGNVVFVTLSLTTGLEQWLWHDGTTRKLAQVALTGSPNQINPDSRLAGGWVAYPGIFSPYTPSRCTQVRLRTAAGADEGVSRAGVGYAARLEALCPDGSVAYGEDTFSPTNEQTFTRRYIACRGGPLVDAGAYDAAPVVCRGGRFFPFSGGTGYELSQ
jgi:hypothetical protein